MGNIFVILFGFLYFVFVGVGFGVIGLVLFKYGFSIFVCFFVFIVFKFVFFFLMFFWFGWVGFIVGIFGVGGVLLISVEFDFECESGVCVFGMVELFFWWV